MVFFFKSLITMKHSEIIKFILFDKLSNLPHFGCTNSNWNLYLLIYLTLYILHKLQIKILLKMKNATNVKMKKNINKLQV